MVLAAVFFLFALTLIVSRPYRMPHQNLAVALLNVLCGLLALTSIGSTNISAASLYLGIVDTAFATVGLTVVIQAVELKWWQPLAETPKRPASAPVDPSRSVP